MPKSKTYFPQVPVEVAKKKVAEAESRGYAAEPLKRPKKNSNGNGLTELKPDED